MALLFISLLFLSYYHVSTGTQCLYQDVNYSEGESVKTSEPCLNCTCTSGVLICYLRVCTTVLPAPAGCVARKQAGSCCADIFCDVEDQTEDYSSPVTSQNNSLEINISSNYSDSNEMKAKLTADLLSNNFDKNQTNMVISSTSYLTDEDLEGGCFINGSLYAEGSAMISSTFCHYCYCIRGKQVCLRPKCHLIIEGCEARYLSNYTCCPTHYVCAESYSSTSVATTLETTDATTLQTTGCTIDEFTYAVGDAVPSTGHCQTCYCSREGIKCSPLQCSPIMDGCVPIIPEGHCCPVEYNCNFTQYPSKHTTNIFNWGIGEVDEIVPSNNETLYEFNTTIEFDSITTPILNLTSEVADIITEDKIEERQGNVYFNQDNQILKETESIELEPISSELNTTIDLNISDMITEVTSDSSINIENSMVTNLNNNVSEVETFFPLNHDVSTVSTLTANYTKTVNDSTETEFSTSITTITIENSTTTETATDFSSSETQTTVQTENSTDAFSSFTNEKTLPTVTFNDFKRSRVEQGHRLPPPFLFLGSRLAVRPFGRGGVTRNPFIKPNVPLRTTKAPLPGYSGLSIYHSSSFPIQEMAGICIVNGRTFMNGEVILHRDPCEICRCISGREICRRQECLPPPSPNCRMEKSPGFCCPHYICVNLPPPALQRRPHIPTSAAIPEILSVEEAEDTTTTSEPDTTTLETTTQTSETTTETLETTSKELPTRLSFIDHLLSLMTPNPTEGDQIFTERQEVVPGSLIGNSWGVLRVSGCNVYGKFYNLNDRVPELSGRCKVCSCDVTGVKCLTVC